MNHGASTWVLWKDFGWMAIDALKWFFGKIEEFLPSTQKYTPMAEEEESAGEERPKGRRYFLSLMRMWKMNGGGSKITEL